MSQEAPESASGKAPLIEGLPNAPVRRWMRPLAHFLEIEAASGAVLLGAAVAAILLANSEYAYLYHSILNIEFGLSLGEIAIQHTVRDWINDGLMTVFFFVVGLEIKREFLFGELAGRRKATLPIAAAFGGMIVPAGIYLALQLGEPGEAGWGIPMATDIAFAVGCLAVLGSRVPRGLRVFILALAIVDDIGAILVIAFGYSSGIEFASLAGASLLFALCALLARVGLRSVPIYFGIGTVIWFLFEHSGVHATVAGVILGFLTPGVPWVGDDRFARFLDGTLSRMRRVHTTDATPSRHAILREVSLTARETISPLERLETALHPWVAFGIMPIFAFANAGVLITTDGFASPIAVAVALGLMVGKPVGVGLFSWIFVRLGLAALPTGVNWPTVIGGGFIAGIGFTVALFIANLALSNELLEAAKIGILSGSAVSAIVGCTLLLWVLPTGGAKAGTLPGEGVR